LIVYGFTVSPFVRKTVVFATEKGLKVEVKPMRPGKDNAELLATSPFGRIPGFRDGDFTISDSSAIVAYMDATKPEPLLIPTDPQSRARTVWFDEFADTIINPVMSTVFFNRIGAQKFRGQAGDLAAADAAERDGLPPLLHYLEAVIPTSDYLVGNSFTLADISVATQFVNFAHAGVKIDPALYPKVTRFLAAVHERPSFVPIIEQERAFLAR
jgi:glutathione S-transferase